MRFIADSEYSVGTVQHRPPNNLAEIQDFDTADEAAPSLRSAENFRI